MKPIKTITMILWVTCVSVEWAFKVPTPISMALKVQFLDP